jgi:hypothetical protein
MYNQSKEEAKEILKKYLKKGDTVYTSLQNVSSSGMYRHIQLLVVNKKRIVNISFNTANLTGYRFKEKTGSIGISGCGMDMGFALVYDLSRQLWKPRKGNDSGYFLKHSWL